MIKCSVLLVALAASLLAVVVHGKQTSDNVTIGEQICTYGYIMDEYCVVSHVNVFRARSCPPLQ